MTIHNDAINRLKELNKQYEILIKNEDKNAEVVKENIEVIARFLRA
jgi:hypothetical protein